MSERPLMDFAATLPPTLRGRLRRCALDLPLSPGEGGIMDRYSGRVCPWPDLEKIMQTELRRFDKLPPETRERIRQTGVTPW